MGDTATAADFHKVLNIPKDSSPDQIRKAYMTLVRKWHPDKHPLSTKHHAEAKFKAITQAYEALVSGGQRDHSLKSASPLRRNHSLDRKDPPQPPPPVRPRTSAGTRSDKGLRPSSTFPSPTAPLFRRKPPPIEKKLECTLEELFRGCRKEVRYTRDVVGKNGLIYQKEEIETVKIRSGWRKGTKITLEEKGDERPGSAPSDVIFTLTEKEHPYFKRSGDDLVLKVEVPLVNALTGWNFSFRTLGGEKLSYSFDSEIVYPGYEKLVKGEGMPVCGHKGTRGDLRIKFKISFPKSLNEDKKTELKFLLKGTC